MASSLDGNATALETPAAHAVLAFLAVLLNKLEAAFTAYILPSIPMYTVS